jgi:hypothetical protein
LLLPFYGFAQIKSVDTTEDAAETCLSVFFADSSGRFFESTPLIQLYSAASGKLVRQAYRTVDEAGNPDRIPIPAGTYVLKVSRVKGEYRMKLAARKNNKVVLTVKDNGILRFRYVDSKGVSFGRPIAEFSAVVNSRAVPGPPVHQRCDQEFQYRPGDYYVEINTLPVSRFNVNIDFNGITEIGLHQPGFVKIIRGRAFGLVSLYAKVSGKFVRFTYVDMERAETQKLRLKPGVYEAHWAVGKGEQEHVTEFRIAAASLTEVVLK